MNKIMNLYLAVAQLLPKLDFVVLLALRLYLAPIFIAAGWQKLTQFDSMVSWFGDASWGLGLPFAPLWVILVIFAELIGGAALLFGVLTRWFALMLSVTMMVAIVKVHLKNVWYAITPTDPTTNISQLFSYLPEGQASLQNSIAAGERLAKANEILQSQGDFEWLTQTGNFVILNNGVEFGVTYLIMLLVLLVFGAGRYLSVDDWFYRLIFIKKR